MSGQVTPPGWYQAQGDPPNTLRWWSGTEWVGGPQAMPTQSFEATPPGTMMGIQDGFPGAPAMGSTSATGQRYNDRSPLEWYKLAWSRYSDFSGRSRRNEYWWFALINLLIGLVFFIPIVLLSDLESDDLSGASLVFLGLLFVHFLVILVPSVAVAVRRLHDTGRSGWWFLIGVIPIVSYIGGIVLLVFYFIDGHRGPNKWGVSPKY